MVSRSLTVVAIAVVVVGLTLLIGAPLCLAGDQCANHGKMEQTGLQSDPAKLDPFRAEHSQITPHLGHMTEMVADLMSGKEEDQLGTMNHVVTCMAGHVNGHAEWEEKTVFPIIDECLGSKDMPSMTASLKHQHKIIAQWIDELRTIANSDEPDVTAFCRKADNLMGLINAHFEEEETMVLEAVCQKMTVDEFKQKVAMLDAADTEEDMQGM